MNESVVGQQSKITQMIETILSSLYMLPFMVLHPDIMSRIKKRLQNNDYKDRRQVVDDLTALITNDGQEIDITVDISLGKQSEKKRISFKREDIDRCCAEIEKKISSFNLTMVLEEQLQQNPVSAKISAALKSRFPNLTEGTLRTKACKISLCKDEEDWKRMVKELIQENENNAKGALFQKYSFFPSGKTQPRSEEFFHQYVAAFHFYRMLFKWTQRGAAIPVPLRKVNIKDFLNFHCFALIRNSFRRPTPMMQSLALTSSRTNR